MRRNFDKFKKICGKNACVLARPFGDSILINSYFDFFLCVKLQSLRNEMRNIPSSREEDMPNKRETTHRVCAFSTQFAFNMNTIWFSIRPLYTILFVFRWTRSCEMKCSQLNNRNVQVKHLQYSDRFGDRISNWRMNENIINQMTREVFIAATTAKVNTGERNAP